MTRSARVIGAVVYKTSTGKEQIVPLGPCLIEKGLDERIDIIWGASGQHSAELPLTELKSAQREGRLVLLI